MACLELIPHKKSEGKFVVPIYQKGFHFMYIVQKYSNKVVPRPLKKLKRTKNRKI
jgi:hypothetical protein